MPEIIYHWHHIVPRHAGGTDDPSNLIRLTIEQHAEAHRILWEEHGRLEDKRAWLGLAGLTDEAAELGQILATKAKQTNLVRAKMSATKAAHWADDEYRNKIMAIRETAEYKEKHKRAVQKASNAPDYINRCRQKATEQWVNPEIRKKQTDAIRHPECRKIRSAKARERWSDPNFRAKMTESQRRRRARERAAKEKS